jgi:hypothetical protein
VAEAFKAASHLKKIVDPGAAEKVLAAQHLHVVHFNEYIRDKHLNS